MIRRFNQIIEVPLEGVSQSERDLEKLAPELKNRIEKVLITRLLLRKRVQALARKIAENYKNENRIEMVFILEGARVFAGDLERKIYECGGPEIRTQSIKAQTYGKEIKGAGEIKREVKIFYAPKDLEGKRVLLVEDIVDQGFTLYSVQNWLLKKAKAKEVKVCALLEKRLKNPSDKVKKLRANLKLDWVGFSIPDRWVAGYGIDAGEDFRFLPFVVVVREEYYQRS